MTTTPRILQYRNDVYLVHENGKGARRWIKKTQKFSGQWYVRRYVLEQGTPVPADHPAWAVVAQLEAEEARRAATERALFGPRPSLES